MNRGNRRAMVFHNESHYQLFVDKLAEFAILYQVRIRCYCCLPNHFHLYVQTLQPNLSHFMQGLLISYTVIVNRWQKSSGHLFQGRFKAHLVEDELYRSRLSRYIHLNPVRIAGISEQDITTRRNYLRNYRWSSYLEYLGTRESPSWLDRELVLSSWGSTLADRIKGYRRYVEEGLLREIDNPFEAIAAQTIIGSDEFVDIIKRRYGLGQEVDKSKRRDRPALVRLQGLFTMEEMAAAVARVYAVEPEDLLKRKSNCQDGRRLLIYCVSYYCRSGMTLNAMAKRMSLTVSGLTRARDRANERLGGNQDFQERHAQVLEYLKAEKTEKSIA
jgi:REP element-mobilizing transposase RayT